MKRHFFGKLLAVALFGLLMCPSAASSRVTAMVEGSSDSVGITGIRGPNNIDQLVTISKTGGSINSAASEALFHKYEVQLKSETWGGTSGDKNGPTHVRSTAMFLGTAKVVSDTLPQGTLLRRFKVRLSFKGDLYSKSEPSGTRSAIAWFSTRLRTGGIDRFTGGGLLDSVAGFSGWGNLAQSFTQETDDWWTLVKGFNVNLGNLRVGQRVRFLLMGTTLACYDKDLPVEYCRPDFLSGWRRIFVRNLSAQEASLEFVPARRVRIFFRPVRIDPASPPKSFRVYIEADPTLLEKIQRTTVELMSSYTEYGPIPAISMGPIGDRDGNGKEDRALVFDGSDVLNLFDPASGVNYQILTVFGQCAGGNTFTGMEILRLKTD